MKLYFYNFKNGEVREYCVTARKNKEHYVVENQEYNDSIYSGSFKYWMTHERKVQNIINSPYMFSSTKIEITEGLKELSLNIQKAKECLNVAVNNIENAVSK